MRIYRPFHFESFSRGISSINPVGNLKKAVSHYKSHSISCGTVMSITHSVSTLNNKPPVSSSILHSSSFSNHNYVQYRLYSMTSQTRLLTGKQRQLKFTCKHCNTNFCYLISWYRCCWCYLFLETF
jgi:hypothetical protein